MALACTALCLYPLLVTCDSAGLLQISAALASLQAKQGATACSQRCLSLQSESFSSCAWNAKECGHSLLYLMSASPAQRCRVVRTMV